MSIVIVFDGKCNLCNVLINFIVRKDTKKKFLFTPLQSNFVKEYQTKNNIYITTSDSVVLIDGERIFTRSSAGLRIAWLLGFPYSILAILYIIPPILRNVLYDSIAKYRYNWFGVRDTCMIPTSDVSNRFLQ